MVEAIRNFFAVEPHPMAAKVAIASERVVRESAKLDRHKDAFADMVRGMRGETRKKARKKR